MSNLFTLKNSQRLFNIFKIFGTHSRGLCAIALAALIGFSFAACDNGTTDTPPPPPPCTHNWKWELTTYPTTTAEGEETKTCTECGATDGTRSTPKITQTATFVVWDYRNQTPRIGFLQQWVSIFESLTPDDIVFTPADVATIDRLYINNSDSLYLYCTTLKPGVVTVSIKPKNGVEFKHDTTYGGRYNTIEFPKTN